MSPTIRRLTKIAAILAGVLILLLLALPYVVSLDSMRARAVSAAEEALRRKVEIGKMRLQIFSGLGAGVEKVVVHNREGFETPALLSADEVSVKVAFWPLLSRRVEVRRIVLKGANVTIERGPDGKLNVDDFLSAGQRQSGPATRTAAAVFLVSRLEIDGSRLQFVDRKVTPGQTVTLAVEDLQGRITDVGPSRPARIELAARFLADAGRNLTFTGTVGPPPKDRPVGTTPVDVAFTAKDVALARLAPYVAAFRTNDPGIFAIDGKAKGELLGVLGLTGNLSLDPATPASPIPGTDGTFAMTLDWTKGTLAIARSLFDVAALPLAIEGRVDDFKNSPRVDIRISTPGEVAIDDVTGLPGLTGRLPEGVSLGGRLRLDARIQGLSSELETHGTVDAAPFLVRRNGQDLLAAPSLHATLGSRGEAPLAGRVSVPSGKLKELPFENLVADWTWHQGALTLAPSATVFGGRLAASLASNLAQPGSESRVSVDVQGVQAQPLIESLTTVRNVFAGALHGTLTLSTRGLTWDAISKTATGQGRVSVADADLRTVHLMPEVARALAAVGSVAGFQVPPSLESTKFATLQTSLALADGRLATPDLMLSGRDVSVSADGSVGLDQTLAYRGLIALGPAIVKSLGSTGKFLADAQGSLTLPFKASGSVTSPKISIDESAVLDLGRRALARQAKEKVGGAAGQILGDVLEGGEGKPASPVDLLQQLLRPPPTPAPTRAPTPR